MKRLIQRHLKRIDELQRLADANELTDEADEVPLLVAEVASAGARAGLPGVVDVCKWTPTDTPIHAGRLILGRALSLSETTEQAEFLTVGQVGDMLGISEKSVRRRVHEGALPPPIKIGRASRWRRLDIENYRGKYK